MLLNVAATSVWSLGMRWEQYNGTANLEVASAFENLIFIQNWHMYLIWREQRGTFCHFTPPRSACNEANSKNCTRRELIFDFPAKTLFLRNKENNYWFFIVLVWLCPHQRRNIFHHPAAERLALNPTYRFLHSIGMNINAHFQDIYFYLEVFWYSKTSKHTESPVLRRAREIRFPTIYRSTSFIFSKTILYIWRSGLVTKKKYFFW